MNTKKYVSLADIQADINNRKTTCLELAQYYLSPRQRASAPQQPLEPTDTLS